MSTTSRAPAADAPQAEDAGDGDAHRLYDQLVDLYPLLSRPEDYTAEARRIRAAVRRLLPRADRTRHQGPGGAGGGGKPTLLELGVGSGHVLSHLTSMFDAVGVDLSPQMLEHAARTNPGVEHHAGDMRDVRLGRTFDAVLIHDAVHYMLTEADLLAALGTAAAHLNPGGALLALPRYVRETFVDGDVSHDLDVSHPTTVGYVMQARDPDPTDTTYQLTMLLMVRHQGRIHVEEDRHTCGLFPVATWMRLLDEAGFEAEAPRLRAVHRRGEEEIAFAAVKR
jgi:hypothetical protein